MPFTKRRGLRHTYRELKPRQVKKQSISIPSNTRIRSNSKDDAIINTKSQVRNLKFSTKRKNEPVEDISEFKL